MTQRDILEGITALLQTRWPEGETAYYTDYAPQGFRRPSFLVEMGAVTQDEAGGFSTDFTAEGIITAFLPVDAYHHSHLPDLCDREAEVMSLFGRGYFPVGDRCPHVTRVTGSHGWDYAQVKLSIAFCERWGAEDPYPLMESVNVKIKNKEGQK